MSLVVDGSPDFAPGVLSPQVPPSRRGHFPSQARTCSGAEDVTAGGALASCYLRAEQMRFMSKR
jgi:hypothetical protein